MKLLDRIADLLAGGKANRLRQAVARVEHSFAKPGDTREDSERAASAYARAIRLALRIDPAEARRLCERYDARVRDEHYVEAFADIPAGWVAGLASRPDAYTLQVCLSLATRLQLPQAQHTAAEQLALLHAQAGDADALIAHLDLCRRLQLIDRNLIETALRAYLKKHPFTENAAWAPFLRGLPETALPPVFEVHLLLERAAAAVRLASDSAQQQVALDCCLRARAYPDMAAGIALAEQLGDQTHLRDLHEHAGDVRAEQGDLPAALDHYTRAGSALKASQCYERLGQPLEALRTCPPDRQERLLMLVGPCEEAVLAQSRDQNYPQAMRTVQEMLKILKAVAEPTPELEARTAAVGRHRDALLRTARAYFADRVEQLSPEEQRPIYVLWSALEEAAGNTVQAAKLAEDAGDYYKASLLWESDEKYGEAMRVLGQHSDRGAVLAKMAEIAERGGDHATAGNLYENAHLLHEACRAYTAAGQYADAARCLRSQLGDDAAAESEEFAQLMRQAGLTEDLLQLWVQQTQSKGRGTRAVEHLRKAVTAASPPRVPGALLVQARTALESLHVADRGRFDLSIADWRD
jgi:molecular chaperone DnaK